MHAREPCTQTCARVQEAYRQKDWVSATQWLGAAAATANAPNGSLHARCRPVNAGTAADANSTKRGAWCTDLRRGFLTTLYDHLSFAAFELGDLNIAVGV